MKNYYLKFVDHADLEDTLISAGLAETYQDEFIPRVTLDVIGIIHKPTGKILTTKDGMKYPEMVPIDGYHANLKAELTEQQEALVPIIPAPTTPYRVWAGE